MRHHVLKMTSRFHRPLHRRSARMIRGTNADLNLSSRMSCLLNVANGNKRNDERKSMIRVKRVYEPAEKSDGARFLIDHLWPRGVKKEALHVERWMKSVSPSNQLRSWFGHEPAKWREFQHRYFAELNNQPETWESLLEAAREKD